MSELKLMEELVGGFTGLFVDILNQKLTSQDRASMAQALKDWLSGVARVKPLPDLEERRARMFQRFDKLAEVAELSKVGDNLVVKASGDGETTLKMLENGTDWFDPCENVVMVMISALWKS